MSTLIWGDPGNRLFTAGVDRGVLYPKLGDPVVWNGLVSIVEAPSDVVVDTVYVDGLKHQYSAGESFTARVNAFTYPDGLLEYEGHNHYRDSSYVHSEMNLSYRTGIGNDVDGIEHGAQIHLVYNALFSPSTKERSSVDAEADAQVFGWDLQTRPIVIEGYRPSAHLIVNTALAYPWAVSALEDVLYGTVTTSPRFPSPVEVMEIFDDAAIVKITDHGDGTWTAEGPDYAVYLLNPTTFEIAWPSAVYIDEVTYTVSSL